MKYHLGHPGSRRILGYQPLAFLVESPIVDAVSSQRIDDHAERAGVEKTLHIGFVQDIANDIANLKTLKPRAIRCGSNQYRDAVPRLQQVFDDL